MTQELVDMFPMIDGLPITESKLYDPKHPYEQRDPRLYETVVVNGDKYYGGIAEIYVGGKHYQDFEGSYGAFMSGYRPRKFILDGGGGPLFEWPAEISGKVVQWPYLRLPELYLGYVDSRVDLLDDFYNYISFARILLYILFCIFLFFGVSSFVVLLLFLRL